MIRTASIQEAAQARSLRSGVFIDVRNADEFERGHVGDATFMPLHIVPLRASELARSETYYVVCESGGRSAQAVAYLAQQGFDVRSVAGGMSAWRSAGLPVEGGLHDSVRG